MVAQRKKLKILEIAHRVPPAIGGSEKVVYELARNFSKKGHDVTVVSSTSLEDSDTKGLSKSKGLSLRSSLHDVKEERKDGFKILRFDPSFQLWTFAPNKEMKRFLKENINDYDIVHVHGYLSYEAQVVSRLCKGYVLTAHDVVSHNPGIYRLFKKAYDILFGRKILRKASKLVALTEENRKEYESVLPDIRDKIKTIPNGIEDHSQVSKKEKDELLGSLGYPGKVILYVGRIVEYKGCQEIVKAMPKILEKHDDALAVFVGAGEYISTLKDIAVSLGVSESCRFMGRVEDVDPYFSIADVFVFPSRGEGFGLAPVEAMSMGIPSLMTDIGGLKFVLSEIGGEKLDSSKEISSQIAEKVSNVFDGGYDKKKISSAKKNAKKYRWDNISETTLELFDEVRDD